MAGGTAERSAVGAAEKGCTAAAASGAATPLRWSRQSDTAPADGVGDGAASRAGSSRGDAVGEMAYLAGTVAVARHVRRC